MPLRDHFRPPLDLITSWEGFHGQWPAVIVQHLRKQLPTGYVAEPRVHSGSQVEIDVAAFEKDDAPPVSRMTEGNGGVPTAVWAPAPLSRGRALPLAVIPPSLRRGQFTVPDRLIAMLHGQELCKVIGVEKGGGRGSDHDLPSITTDLP